ncbi:MAG: hypothetical protein Crog4KO_14240 [Crocinitomicaceae bacterium]
MKKEMIEEQVFDLLETKDFHDLSTDEKSLVLSISTQEEYELQRSIIVEGARMEDETPPPFLLPVEKRGVLPIWLASACSAAAAAIAVVLWMPPSDSYDFDLKMVTVPAVQDTLIVENTVVDTVIDYRYVEVEKAVDDCCPTNEDMVQIPEFTGSAPTFPMRKTDFENKGVSVANDADLEAFRSRPFIGM